MSKVKMKTKRAVAKRFTVTGSSKIKRGNQNTSHLALSKSQKRKRHLRKASLMSTADTRRLNRLIAR